MIEASDFQKVAAELNRDIAVARRQIISGEAVDLSELPKRMADLCQIGDVETARSLQASLLALMSECDDLVREIEHMQAKLGKELRSDRDRQQAFQAYRPQARS